MELYIYNTLTRQKELFVPSEPWKVKIYSCGPTVYSTQHLGNLRAVFLIDLLKNTIKYIMWYETTHVMNITDVWHLTWDNEWDADHGEDRMEKWARKEWLTARDVAKKYTDIYMNDLSELRIDAFDTMPKATDHIAEQIAMIQELETKWYTYIIPNDGVYMDTSKVSNYGALIGKKHLEWLEQWARIEDAGKRNMTDFALWKFNITGKKRDMEWESPWWIWFPGWHIECSAMSMKYLGNTIDIHTGWIEHIPIHHTNEIAQSECSHGHNPWVKYRWHYQHLMMNGKKLAKSEGNVAYMSEVLEKWYTWEDLRYFYFQAQYNNFQDFTWEGLEAAKTTRHNIIRKIAAYIGERIVDFYDVQKEDLNDILYHQLVMPLVDDIDTPKLLAHLQKALGNINDEVLKILLYLDKILLKIGLYEWVDALVQAPVSEIPADIQALAQSRRDAKKAWDFALADAIRKQLLAEWRAIEDAKEWFSVMKA